MVKWLAILLSIRDVTGSNTSPNTDYPGFPQSLQENSGAVSLPQIKSRPNLSIHFPKDDSSLNLSFEAVALSLSY
jgi:hypothetical protein